VKTQEGGRVARWGWVVNTIPWVLYPKERPGALCRGGWVVLGAGPDGYKILHPHWDLNSRPFSV